MSTEKAPKVANFLAQRTSSESFLNTQNDEYNTFLSELRDIEAHGEDSLVKINTIKPVDVSKEGAWTVEIPQVFGTKQFLLNDQAIGQLGARRSKSAYGKTYGYTIPEQYQTTDIHGEPVTVPLRALLLREAMLTRPKAKANFRQVYNPETGQMVTKGIVGENYPLDFSDVEVLDQIYKKATDLGLNPKPSHFNHYKSGAIRASFMFDTDDFVFEHKDAKENFGVFFKNSRFGDDPAGGGSYVYTEICTNGMMGWKSQYSFRINHTSRKSFIKNIISKLTQYRKSEEFALFSRDYGIDEIGLYGDGSNYATFDRIYPEIAIGLIFKSIQGSKFLKSKYQRAMEIVVKDWRKELEAQVKKHNLGTKKLPTLHDLAIQDPTLGMYQKEGSLYDISGLLTSAGNLYTGEPSVAFQEAAMQVITGKNLTPLLKVS